MINSLTDKSLVKLGGTELLALLLDAHSATVTSIRSGFVFVVNLQEVVFADTNGKLIKVPDPTYRPTNLAYFTFHSIVSTVAIDKRVPDKLLYLEFSLRLPRNYQFTETTSTVLGTPTTNPFLATKPFPLVDARDTMINSLTDKSLAKLGGTELLALLLDAHSAILSPLFVLVLFSLLTCRELYSRILTGNSLWSQTPPTALRILLILPFIL